MVSSSSQNVIFFYIHCLSSSHGECRFYRILMQDYFQCWQFFSHYQCFTCNKILCYEQKNPKCKGKISLLKEFITKLHISDISCSRSIPKMEAITAFEFTVRSLNKELQSHLMLEFFIDSISSVILQYYLELTLSALRLRSSEEKIKLPISSRCDNLQLSRIHFRYCFSFVVSILLLLDCAHNPIK